MDEGDIVTACALSDPAGREAHSFLSQPLHALRKRVYPQSDVIQRRDMNSAHSGATGMRRCPGAVDISKIPLRYCASCDSVAYLLGM